MPPNDRRDCAAQILWCGLALGPARLNQRLQAHPCSVRQHRSSSHWEEQNARNHNRFKREQALELVPSHRAKPECNGKDTDGDRSREVVQRTEGLWLQLPLCDSRFLEIEVEVRVYLPSRVPTWGHGDARAR